MVLWEKVSVPHTHLHDMTLYSFNEPCVQWCSEWREVLEVWFKTITIMWYPLFPPLFLFHLFQWHYNNLIIWFLFIEFISSNSLYLCVHQEGFVVAVLFQHRVCFSPWSASLPCRADDPRCMRGSPWSVCGWTAWLLPQEVCGITEANQREKMTAGSREVLRLRALKKLRGESTCRCSGGWNWMLLINVQLLEWEVSSATQATRLLF